MMETARERLFSLVEFHCRASKISTPVPGLTLFRSSTVTKPARSLYDPRLCVVLQGRKRVVVGHRQIEIGPEHYLVVVIDVPVSAYVVEAGPTKPHFSLTIDLDAKMVAETIADSFAAIPLEGKNSVDIATLTADIYEPIERLVRLLDRPEDIKTLAPLIYKELYYRLLTGELRSMIGQFGTTGSRLARIAGATTWIRANFRKRLDIEELAYCAGMSVTSFYRNFKAATSYSPLQFRSRLRLHEARRQILLKRSNIGTIAFEVGYENQPQFNREYRKMFGASPRDDVSSVARI